MGFKLRNSPGNALAIRLFNDESFISLVENECDSAEN